MNKSANTLNNIIEGLKSLVNLARVTSSTLKQGIKIDEVYKLPHGLDIPLEVITLRVEIGYIDGLMTFANFGVFDFEDFDEYRLSKTLTNKQFTELEGLIKNIMSKVLTKEELKFNRFLGDEHGIDNYVGLEVIH